MHTDNLPPKQSKLEHLIKTTYKVPEAPAGQEAGMTVPVTNCPVYMRLQPVLAPLPSLPSSCLPTSTPDPTALKSLFFLVLLRDPTHHLVHSSLSQSMPASWLEIPFEENEWVEDAMVEIIRRSVEIIGQEYISVRASHARFSMKAIWCSCNLYDLYSTACGRRRSLSSKPGPKRRRRSSSTRLLPPRWTLRAPAARTSRYLTLRRKRMRVKRPRRRAWEWSEGTILGL